MLGKMLPPDVLEELTDEKFINRKHYSRTTYNAGCRGPLCKKWRREKNRTNVPPVKPYIGEDREAKLDAIIEWLRQGSEKLSA